MPPNPKIKTKAADISGFLSSSLLESELFAAFVLRLAKQSPTFHGNQPEVLQEICRTLVFSGWPGFSKSFAPIDSCWMPQVTEIGLPRAESAMEICMQEERPEIKLKWIREKALGLFHWNQLIWTRRDSEP